MCSSDLTGARFAGNKVSINRPFESAVVPMLVPETRMLAPGRASFVVPPVTRPDTVFCANPLKLQSSAKHDKIKRLQLFIIVS